MLRVIHTATLLCGIVSLFAPTLAAQESPRVDEVLKWNEVLINAVRQDKTTPPLAARNMAIVHVAIYDSVNAILRTHTPYRYEVMAPPFASPDAAAAAAAHRALTKLYPAQRQTFDEALRLSLLRIPDGPPEIEGVRLGSFVADRFLEWRSRDDSITAIERVAGTEPGTWSPTPPRFQKPLLPQWGRVARFAVSNSTQFHPATPVKLSSAEYARMFNEVKELGAAESSTRTEDQTQIAHFWADGPGTATPPGHWNDIARTVAMDRANTMPENARLFAQLNIAMADAAILCWECKFKFNLWRPIAGIRQADTDNNPDTVMDPAWTPLLETPPFPAYTSGHSSFSSSGATVLAKFFGTDRVRFKVTSDAMPGVKRAFTSFSEAAEEAGRSRIYGGIHWDCDNVEGLAMGKTLGEHVYRTTLLARR